MGPWMGDCDGSQSRRGTKARGVGGVWVSVRQGKLVFSLVHHNTSMMGLRSL